MKRCWRCYLLLSIPSLMVKREISLLLILEEVLSELYTSVSGRASTLSLLFLFPPTLPLPSPYPLISPCSLQYIIFLPLLQLSKVVNYRERREIWNRKCLESLNTRGAVWLHSQVHFRVCQTTRNHKEASSWIYILLSSAPDKSDLWYSPSMDQRFQCLRSCRSRRCEATEDSTTEEKGEGVRGWGGGGGGGEVIKWNWVSLSLCPSLRM